MIEEALHFPRAERPGFTCDVLSTQARRSDGNARRSPSAWFLRPSSSEEGLGYLRLMNFEAYLGGSLCYSLDLVQLPSASINPGLAATLREVVFRREQPMGADFHRTLRPASPAQPRYFHWVNREALLLSTGRAERMHRSKRGSCRNHR